MAGSTGSTATTPRPRVESIDALRGLAMVVMAGVKARRRDWWLGYL